MLRFVPRIAAVLLLVMAGTLATAAAGERPIQAEGRGALITGFDFTFLVGPGIGEHLGGCRLDIRLSPEELYYGNIVPQYTLMLEAANGDRLFAFVDSEYDPETGIVAGTITFFTGTGRFADATGSARLRIVPDTYWFDYSYQPIEETRFSWVLDGTIDY